MKEMPLICEICGKEIIAPNYIYYSFEGIYENFYECAKCILDRYIEQYNEFKEDFPKEIDFHLNSLIEINKLNFELLSFNKICLNV